MNCREATALVSQALEWPLATGTQLRLRLHLLTCSGCRNFGRQAPWLRDLLRAHAQGQDERPPRR